MQPRTISDLGISHVVFLQVLAELVGRALERGHRLQHRDRQLEIRDVLDERRRAVRGLEIVRESLEILRRHRDAPLCRQLQDGFRTNRAIEVEMQLGLR